MVNHLNLLGLLDVHSVANLVFLLRTRVSITQLLLMISVSRNLNGLLSIVSFTLGG